MCRLYSAALTTVFLRTAVQVRTGMDASGGDTLRRAAQVLGDNLLSLIKMYDHRGIPLPLVKRITRQVCPSHLEGAVCRL